MTLSRHYYGKENVRLTKVVRRGEHHTLYEFNVQVLLEGAFDRVYTHGDNASCVPTDTMKNTIYALGKTHDFDSPEAFALLLVAHFLDNFQHVSGAAVQIEQILWERIPVAGTPHGHAFQRSSTALRTASVKHDRSGIPPTVTGGVTGLALIKTGHSAFTGFLTDRYTTLKPTTDRLMGTSLDAAWTFTSPGAAFNETFEGIRRSLLETFATHDSLGVQHTLFAMGNGALAVAPAISQIALTAPNAHRIPFNLEPLGLKNENDIFISTPEPAGLIHATITR